MARVLVQREHRTESRGNIVAFHVLGEQVPIRVPKLLATRYKLYMSTLAPTIPIAALHGREQPLGHALVRRCTTSSVKPTAFSFILDLGDHFRHNAFGFCDGLPTGGWCRAGNRLAENGRQGFRFRDAVFPQRTTSPQRSQRAEKILVQAPNQLAQPGFGYVVILDVPAGGDPQTAVADARRSSARYCSGVRTPHGHTDAHHGGILPRTGLTQIAVRPAGKCRGISGRWWRAWRIPIQRFPIRQRVCRGGSAHLFWLAPPLV